MSSAPDRHYQYGGFVATFAELPESLAPKAQSFLKPGRLLIDGASADAMSGKTLETFNPGTEESLGQLAHGAA